jgi:2-dehydro-3-deoxyglucarate aldolase/4-hydroxy-2-oxoheptanedioate aldolase
MPVDFPAALRSGRPQIGTLLSLPSPELAEIAVEAGFDWLFLDLEHGLPDIRAVQGVIQAVAGRCPCIVRVPDHGSNGIARALDTGADGLIFPHVNSAAEARSCVRAALYPPDGERSVGIARAQGWGARVREALARANRATCRIAQIEHIDAVRSIGEIAAVPGLDALFIGPFDLSASLGRPGEVTAAPVQEAVDAVRRTAAEGGLPIGIFAASAEAAAALARDYGFLCVGTDALIFGDGARRIVERLKA